MDNNILEKNFPKSYDHVSRADKDMYQRFNMNSDNFGHSEREGWMPSSVYSSMEFRDFDNALIGLSALMNSFLGQGMRVNADIPNSRAGEFQEELGLKFFDDKFHNTEFGKALRTDVYPSETLRFIAHASENGIDARYPASFPQYANSAAGEVKYDPEYKFFIEHDEIFDDVESYLEVAATQINSDLEELAEDLELPDTEEDYNIRVLEAADELEGTTAVVTQSGPLTDHVDDYDDVLLQTPELALQYSRQNMQ